MFLIIDKLGNYMTALELNNLGGLTPSSHNNGQLPPNTTPRHSTDQLTVIVTKDSFHNFSVDSIQNQQIQLNHQSVNQFESSSSPKHAHCVYILENDEEEAKGQLTTGQIKNSRQGSQRNSLHSSIYDSTVGLGSVKKNNEPRDLQRKENEEDTFKSTCSKVSTSIADFGLGLVKLVPLSAGVAISLADTAILGLTTLVTAPFMGCSKKGRQITNNMMEATAFQFRLAKVGVTHIVGQVLLKPSVYIEEHCCAETYANYDGVLIKEDGPLQKMQKGFYKKTNQLCCILPKQQRRRVPHMKERSCWTIMVSKLVFANDFNNEQIISHKATETYNFRINNAPEIIEKAITDDVDAILFNLKEQEVHPTEFIVMQIKNLGAQLVTYKLVSKEKENAKERSAFKKLAYSLANQCELDHIDFIMQVLNNQSKFTGATLRYVNQFIIAFMRACFEMGHSRNNKTEGWQKKVEAACIAFEKHLYPLNSEGLLGKCLEVITTKEIFSIAFKNMPKYAEILIRGYTELDKKGQPIKTHTVLLTAKNINDALVESGIIS